MPGVDGHAWVMTRRLATYHQWLASELAMTSSASVVGTPRAWTSPRRSRRATRTMSLDMAIESRTIDTLLPSTWDQRTGTSLTSKPRRIASTTISASKAKPSSRWWSSTFLAASSRNSFRPHWVSRKETSSMLRSIQL